MNAAEQPTGELSIRMLAMPKDTNVNGDIFGGWLVCLMDLGASYTAAKCCKGRCATIAIDKMVFHHPVHVGDTISCYSELLKIGNTSMTIRVQAWVIDIRTEQQYKVTEGIFTFVAIDDQGRPRAVKASI